MGFTNMQTRREISHEMRQHKAGNRNHPRWGFVGLRRAGSKSQSIVTLTVPAKLNPTLADAFERNQQYTCEVDAAGRIIFTPSEGR